MPHPYTRMASVVCANMKRPKKIMKKRWQLKTKLDSNCESMVQEKLMRKEISSWLRPEADTFWKRKSIPELLSGVITLKIFSVLVMWATYGYGQMCTNLI